MQSFTALIKVISYMHLGLNFFFFKLYYILFLVIWTTTWVTSTNDNTTVKKVNNAADISNPSKFSLHITLIVWWFFLSC